MRMSSVCRVCLAGNTTLYSLKNNELVDVYERLSKTKINSQDAGQRALCHICYQKLLRCHTFSQTAHRSEKIFCNLYDKGIEATHEYITKLNLGMKQQLSMATMQFFIIDGNTNTSSQVTIKQEPISSVDIKEEVTTEQDTFLEFKFVPEGGTESQLTLQDNSHRENDVKYIHNIHFEQTKPDDSKMSFICNDCKQLFFLKRELILHIRNSHPQLKINKDTITEEISLNKEKKDHNGKKPFVCYICDKQFKHNYTFIKHMRLHTGEKPFACSVCDKPFSRKNNLDVHMRIHTGEKPFACNVCDKRSNRRSDLIEHMRIHTGEKPFTCSVCDKQFSRKNNLVCHMRIHTGEKPFACSVCDKQFSYKKILVGHMRMHTGEKPFACNVCDKQFSRKYILVDHIKIHTGENLFACSVCDKKFICKNSLVVHMRIHTGEKPFACNVCDKRSNRKCDLIKHMRIHTGEKPFACSVCDKQFSRKNYLVNHMRIHTGEKTFACSDVINNLVTNIF